MPLIPIPTLTKRYISIVCRKFIMNALEDDLILSFISNRSAYPEMRGQRELKIVAVCIFAIRRKCMAFYYLDF